MNPAEANIIEGRGQILYPRGTFERIELGGEISQTILATDVNTFERSKTQKLNDFQWSPVVFKYKLEYNSTKLIANL